LCPGKGACRRHHARRRGHGRQHRVIAVGAHRLFQEVEHRAHRRAVVAALRIRRVQPVLARHVLAQYRHQRAALQVRLRQRLRHIGHAHAAQCQLDERDRVVGFHAAVHRHVVRLAVGLEGQVRGGHGRIAQHVVTAHVFGHLGNAALGPVGRRGADHHVELHQPPHDQIHVVDAPARQVDVDAFADQVDLAVGKDQAHIHVRVELDEFGNHVRHPPGDQAVGRAHAQTSARMRAVGLQVVERVLGHRHQFGAAVEQNLAGIGQAQGAGGAVQQAHAAAGFEFRDVAADSGFRHAQRNCRAGKAAPERDFAKCFDEIETVHGGRIVPAS